MYPLPDDIRIPVAAGRFERALSRAEKALDHAPNHIEWLQVKARMLMKTQRYDEAASTWRDIIAFGPVSPRAHVELAMCLAELESIESAAYEQETAFALDADARELADDDPRLAAVLRHV